MTHINYLTICSPSEYDILRELKHLEKLQIIRESTKGIRVRFNSDSTPYEWLNSLSARYNWWIKNEWISQDGRAGVWISDGTNYTWDDLSLDDEHYIF